MKKQPTRRSFFKRSAAAALAMPMIASLEEYALAAQTEAPSALPVRPGSKGTMPTGKIGSVNISRLICGGNLISGYAHSRDLIYVSRLLKAYFTEERIMQTWGLCEAHGVNTMIFTPSDRQALEIFRKYKSLGGTMQCIGQLSPNPNELAAEVKQAADAGMSGAVLVGNLGDAWTREGALDRIAEFVSLVKAQKMIAGVAGHELRTIKAVEKANVHPDFYMKTLHSTNYWSKRRPDQMKEVIDNYGIDNYWCLDPDDTVRYMSELERPWLAYKVLAAGAIHPQAGFKYAFQNGADFCVVGMFDFQVAEDVTIANAILKEVQNRDRAWMA